MSWTPESAVCSTRIVGVAAKRVNATRIAGGDGMRQDQIPDGLSRYGLLDGSYGLLRQEIFKQTGLLSKFSWLLDESLSKTAATTFSYTSCCFSIFIPLSSGLRSISFRIRSIPAYATFFGQTVWRFGVEVGMLLS